MKATISEIDDCVSDPILLQSKLIQSVREMKKTREERQQGMKARRNKSQKDEGQRKQEARGN